MRHRCLSMACVAVLLLCSFPAPAQQRALLDAPIPAVSASSGDAAVLPVRAPASEPPPGFTRTDWALLTTGAALRFLDYQSTVKMMSDPVNFREVELPQSLVHNRAAFAAFEAGTVVANYCAYRFFVQHHHRRLARAGQAINLAVLSYTAAHNYYEINQFWPKQNLFHEDYPVRQ